MRPSTDVLKYVVSAGRAANVGKMAHHMEHAYAWDWIVPAGEQLDYAHAAGGVQGVPSTQVTHQRQHALAMGQMNGRAVAMVDDDLTRLMWSNPVDGGVVPVSLEKAIDIIYGTMLDLGARYGGVGPTNNLYFVKHPVQTRHFIRSALVVVRTDEVPIAYDHVLKVKEDYDFTLQHLERDEVVARCDALLASFTYRSNGGGCQRYRSPEVETEAIDHLIRKWPSYIKLNPRRAGEVVLRWKR